MSTVEPIRQKKDLVKIENILKSNKRDWVLFKIGINFGLRISDILALNVCDIKNKKVIKILEKKTQKKRIIPVNKELRKLIHSYIKDKSDKEPLFTNTKHKQRLSRISAYRIINTACKKAGIEGSFGTHTLRKTFGYHFYKQFKDIVMLQKILNHSSSAITLRYIGIEQDEIFKNYLQFKL